MARDRLAGVNRTYGDQSAPQQTYPPASNGVIGNTRQQPAYGENPYANAGSANPYGQQQQQQPAYGGQPGYGAPQQQYGQQQNYGAGGNGAGAMGGGGGGITDFWSELSSTNSLLGQLQEQIQAVRQAHQQSLTSTDPQAAAYADQLNDQARGQREACKNQIKSLYKMAKGDKAAKNQVEACKTRFTSLLNEHQVIEKEFRKKVKDRVERQYRIVNPQATPEEVRQVTESDNPQVFAQALLSSNRYGDARGAYREVQERHAEILKIERTLTELAQMFSEMSMLVEQQDEVIVNVETQAQGVDTDIKEGLRQTTKAVDHARAARRKKWICFWIVIVILVIVGAVLGGYYGSGANTRK